MTGLSADYFDNRYADMESAPLLEEAKQRIRGLPAGWSTYGHLASPAS